LIRESTGIEDPRFSAFDRAMMRRVLAVAGRGRGLVSPNPMVGAVVVRDGQVVATGYHHRHGSSHAEVDALSRIGFDAEDCTLYVNLEPCCHQGMTPPCTSSVISSGVSRVVIGTMDPNPLVSGRGIASLRQAGLQVDVGLLESACRELNRGFFKWITTGLPFVTLKMACTLDGRTADRHGRSRWITGEPARRDVHRLRADSDCVMVGGNTASHDDPLLLPVMVRARRNPVRAVVSGSGGIEPGSRLAMSVGDGPVFLFTSDRAARERVDALAGSGIQVISVPSTDDGLDLPAVLRELGARRITSVMVEGGSTLAASLLRASLVDRLVVYYAPILVGDPSAPGLCSDMGIHDIGRSLRFKLIDSVRVGCDVRMRFDPEG